MRTIKEVIDELTHKGIKPFGAESHFYDYTDNEESLLKTLLMNFFISVRNILTEMTLNLILNLHDYTIAQTPD
ncbi:MAG: hypothetical protein WKG06_12940 [Segetibacter sp.]